MRYDVWLYIQRIIHSTYPPTYPLNKTTRFPYIRAKKQIKFRKNYIYRLRRIASTDFALYASTLVYIICRRSVSQCRAFGALSLFVGLWYCIVEEGIHAPGEFKTISFLSSSPILTPHETSLCFETRAFGQDLCLDSLTSEHRMPVEISEQRATCQKKLRLYHGII